MKNLVLLLTLTLNLNLVYSQTPADFTLTDTDGNTYTLSEELSSGRIVLLDFMATWCPNCNVYVPALEQIFQEYGVGEKVWVWAIDVYDNETVQQIKDYKSSLGATYPAFPQGSAIADKYNVIGIPHFVVICPDNSIVYNDISWQANTEADIRNAIISCGVTGVRGGNNENSHKSAYIFPNPVSQQTSLVFSLKKNESVRIELFDLLGQKKIAVLNQQLFPGVHSVGLDLSALSAGNYFIKFFTQTEVQTIRLSILN